jgi:hypothetical protein
MLAKMKATTQATQGRMGANLNDPKEDIKSGQEEVRSIVRAFHGKTNACVVSRRDDREETMPCQETMEPRLNCEEPISEDIKACQETTACHEATEADTEQIESSPGMIQSVAEHQVAPKEDAIVKPVKGGKSGIVAGRRGEPKEMTRADCGPGRKLAAACRKVSRRARLAWRKGTSCEKSGTRKIVDSARSLPPPEQGRPAVQRWHEAGNTG